MPRPISRQIFGSCVDLPEPVSPQTITTWWSRMARAISSRRAETGSSASKLHGRHALPPGLAAGDRTPQSLQAAAAAAPAGLPSPAAARIDRSVLRSRCRSAVIAWAILRFELVPIRHGEQAVIGFIVLRRERTEAGNCVVSGKSFLARRPAPS